MELASLLAGEPFSAHPRSVSPMVAAFLRMYNDRLDDTRRQDLYAVAVAVVGTRAGAGVEQRRGERLLMWSRSLDRTTAWQAPFLSWKIERRAAKQSLTAEDIARFAIHAIGPIDDEVHAATLGIVAELIAMTESTTPTTRSASVGSGDASDTTAYEPHRDDCDGPRMSVPVTNPVLERDPRSLAWFAGEPCRRPAVPAAGWPG